MIKTNMFRFLSVMFAGLIISTTSIADTVQPVISEEAADVSSEEECGIDLINPPKPITTGEVSYVSGGICIGGVNQMKSMAKDFPLEIVLVEKSDEYEKENYIADVKVKINDASDNLILDVVTEGPFLLVDLPNGNYQITAEYHNVVKSRRVKINKNKHERVVFLWPTQPPGD